MLRFIYDSFLLISSGLDADAEWDLFALTASKSLQLSGGSKMAAVAEAQPAVKTEKRVNEVSWLKTAVTHRSNHRFSPEAIL